MIKIAVCMLALCSMCLASPLLNLNKLLDIKRSFGDVGVVGPTVYRNYGYPSTYVAVNGVPSVPVVSHVSSGYPVGYSANTGYISPPSYYNPHTGLVSGQHSYGNYPTGYNGYGHSYGWKH
ncbi:hypothetical protein WA026_022007 [Henosepilachna vigintioctopunctata]|uniref:Prisilkin-39 n=1 Tax=Henosepilachna vigintioctopunctata TaxID=420089 RepID=A0AAW1V637_9CUCU